jgi:hypothetical protein
MPTVVIDFGNVRSGGRGLQQFVIGPYAGAALQKGKAMKYMEEYHAPR